MLAVKLVKSYNNARSKFRIIAFFHNQYPHQHGLETLDLLLKLAHNFPEQVSVELIPGHKDAGSIPDSLPKLIEKAGKAPHRTKELLDSERFLYGIDPLTNPKQFALLYRRCDIFIDMSTGQSTSPLSLHSMATAGCIPIIGSASEFCSGELLDLCQHSKSPENFYSTVVYIMQQDTKRKNLLEQIIRYANHCSIEEAAGSIASKISNHYKTFVAGNNIGQ